MNTDIKCYNTTEYLVDRFLDEIIRLSLVYVKNIDDVLNFISNKEFLIMCKMDGLTCSLRYVNGTLVSAETRGDGYIGEDVLHNILAVKNVPGFIGYKDELIIDGEVICKYQDLKV